MLARTIGPTFSKFPCYLQPKLNGCRALAQHMNLQSRDEKLWRPSVLLHLFHDLKVCDDVFGPNILDGEFYLHGWKLQRINGAIAVNRTSASEDTKQMQFHVFDVVDPNKSFAHRWFETYHRLTQLQLAFIKPVPTHLVQNRGEVELYFNQYTAQGYEGVMLRPDGPYEFGESPGKRVEHMTQHRSEYLWKYKSWLDGEFVCVSWTKGEGKADIGIGALVLSKNDPVTGCASVNNKVTDSFRDSDVFKVGTGFDDSERIVFAKDPPIGKFIRVRYLCLTDDGIPFNPSFIAVMS